LPSDKGPDAGLGVEGRNAGAAGADALGERALRVELDLELVCEILLGEGLVLADVGADHLLDLPRLEQDPEADAVDAGVVGDDRQALDAGIADGLDQDARYAAQPEAAGHDRHVVAKETGKGSLAVRIDLLHLISLDAGAPSSGKCSDGALNAWV
jgi:hypothetical protein